MGPEESAQSSQDRVDGLEVSVSSADVNNRTNSVQHSNEERELTSSITQRDMEKNSGDAPRLMKFNGKKDEDYNLWRRRVEFAFKGKKYWKHMKSNTCSEEMQDDACALLVGALGNVPFRVCQHVDNPMEMLKLLDQRYASNSSTAIIGLMGQVYSKRYSYGKPMSIYIDEFSQLFCRLEAVGEGCQIPDKHKAPILISSLGKDSLFESTAAALRLKSPQDLTWDSVSSLFIQEDANKSVKAAKGDKMKHASNSGNSRNTTPTANKVTRSNQNQDMVCLFCGSKGHLQENCFVNPKSPRCKMSDQAKKNIQACFVIESNSDIPNKNTTVFGGFACLVKSKCKHHSSLFTASNQQNRSQIQDTTKIVDEPCLDSGASRTMFVDKDDAIPNTYQRGSKEEIQTAVGSSKTSCVGSGTYQHSKIVIPNALHVKNLNQSLISVGDVCDTGKVVVFTAKEAIILNRSKVALPNKDIFEVVKRQDDGLYKFKNDPAKALSVRLVRDNQTELWHRRLVHANNRVVQDIHKYTKDVPRLIGKLDPCHPCIVGKMTKKTFTSSFTPTSYPGEIVHSDLAGKFPASVQGARYMCNFIDQFSRYIMMTGIRRKSDTKAAFNEYSKCHISKWFRKGIVQLHTDGGGEYAPIDVKNLLHTTTTPETPQHNAFAERLNRTILDPARTILVESGVPQRYWVEACQHVVYVKNRIYHSGINCSPFQKLTGAKPTLKYLRVFGCAAFVLDRDPNTKLSPRALKGLFLGCTDNGIFKIMLLDNRKIILSPNVKFDEDSFPGLNFDDVSTDGSDDDSDYNVEESTHTNESGEDSDEISYDLAPKQADSTHQEESEIRNEDTFDAGQQPRTDQQYNENNPITSMENLIEPPTRPTRIRRKPDRFIPTLVATDKAALNLPITTGDEPLITDISRSTPAEKRMWKAAIREELESLHNSGAWTPMNCQIPNGSKPLPTHMVFKIKRNNHGAPIRFKARLVAGGHRQVAGRDYDNVYTPVVGFNLFRLMMILSIKFGWKTRHVDIKTAFLNGDIDREIYVKHPTNVPDEMRLVQNYQLLKSLYGLHQAPLQWFLKLKVTLNGFGYNQTRTEETIFLKSVQHQGNEILVYILIYVDDLIFFSSDESVIDEATNELLSTFEGSNDGEVSWYLGVSVEKNDRFTNLSQTAYIDSILEEHGMQNCSSSDTPMSKSFHTDVIRENASQPCDQAAYRNIIGSLIYLSSRTRPDISTAVNILAQYCEKPTKFTMKAALKLLRYLKRTRTKGLRYSCNLDTELIAYCDSDFAGDNDDRKSRTGFVLQYGGYSFDWLSKKQSTTAQSTSEAEYYALSECVKSVCYIKNLLSELDAISTIPTIYSDNNACISWARGECRSVKHIDIRYFFVREKFENSVFDLKYVHTNSNISDLLTKPLEKLKFNMHSETLGVTQLLSGLQEEC